MSDTYIPDSPKDSYWETSAALREILERRLSPADMEWARPQLEAMGAVAVSDVEPLAAIADRESPRFEPRNARGERIDEIVYHPAYRDMERIAYGSGMISIKYEEESLDVHPDAVQLVGFGLGYLFAMAEMGLYCPVCMTDGVARILSMYGGRERFGDAIDRLAARSRPELWTGGMFLTEKIGGSDVGANETIAAKKGDSWTLTGEKWFCSNVDADAVLVTARPEDAATGTKGLRTFFATPRTAPGVRIERIKEKLGVRSMPTGEVTLDGTPVEDVGDFHVITEMLNLSRLYNSVAAVAVMGRAAREARYYMERRRAFGRAVVEHPLASETLLDIEAEHRGAVHLTFEVVDLIGREDRGDDEAKTLRRFLTPIVKAVTGKLAVPVVSECMELIGGNAYIEESPLPRLLRDAQVLPIWEGTTNILALDAARAIRKSGGHEIILDRIRKTLPDDAMLLEASLSTLEERGARQWMDRFARAFEVTLLRESGDDETADRLLRRPLGLLPGAKV